MSAYMNSLSGDVKSRYEEKLALIGNVDPYNCDDLGFTRDMSQFPDLTYIDIVNYLVFQKSAFTQEDFNCYKSLDSYRFFKCGWVRDLLAKSFGDNVLVCGKVLHSQRLRENPLKPWFVAKKSGSVLCAHCDCLAGLGETCSHVAAIMFAVDQAVRDFEPQSVTEKKSVWLAPRSNAGKMSSWEDTLSALDTDSDAPSTSTVHIPALTDEELSDLFNFSIESGIMNSVMTTCKPYCNQIFQERQDRVQRTLGFMFKEENLLKSLEDLRALANDIHIVLSQEDCDNIELTTRAQSKSQDWMNHRIGRVTASRFKSVCKTSTEKPAISLIKIICYPMDCKFYSKATEHGCKHEKVALDIYKQTMLSKHNNFAVESVGLVINPDFPHFGASPDSLCACDCCGEGCVEIKCPYCVRNSSVKDLLSKKQSCLDSVSIQLKSNHAFYYQIQMQLALTKKLYCDFVIWTNKELLIERIYPNKEMWDNESKKATVFWKRVILPELLGKFYTKTFKPQTSTSKQQ